MTHWKDNIARLVNIKTQDPVFWDHMCDMAKVITSSNCKYINDHRLCDEETEENLCRATQTIDSVTICQQFDRDGNLRKSISKKAYKTDSHPIAWIFAGPYPQLCGRTKNPLYLRNGRIHLTMCATGDMLQERDENEMWNGKVIVQKREFGGSYTHEENFCLPIDVFVETMMSDTKN